MEASTQPYGSAIVRYML